MAERMVGYKRRAAQFGPDPKRPRVTLEDFYRHATKMLRSACMLHAGIALESQVTHGPHQLRVAMDARFEVGGKGRVRVSVDRHSTTFVLHSPYNCDRAGQLLEEALAVLILQK